MKRLLASCFGLGRLPLAPGTWGSLPPAIIFALLCYFETSAILLSIVMAALALAGSIVCVKCASAVIAATGKSDPRQLVADEFAGQALVFVAAAFLHEPDFMRTAVLGFVFFRIFDIAKPWPIRRLEKLPSGWGILADDLLAGLYAAIALVICLRLWAACSVS
jgi:phosphatidylglycerophosphatase A